MLGSLVLFQLWRFEVLVPSALIQRIEVLRVECLELGEGEGRCSLMLAVVMW